MIYGIGTDIVKIKRVEKMINRWQERFLDRVFTKDEIEYCRKKSDSFPCFAARLAAKEAAGKMFGTGLGEINWKDIGVLNDRQGNPYLEFKALAKNKIKKNNIENVHLSLSHEKEYAIAYVIAEGGKYDCSDSN